MKRFIDDRKDFRYLSTRILFMFSFVMIFLMTLAVISLLLGVESSKFLSFFFFLLLFLIVFLAMFFFAILLPYRKQERLMRRFLEGHLVEDYSKVIKVFLTPTTELELKKIDELFSSPRLFELNKRQAQYLALQNQINPHFLYNTLESIRSEALISGLHSVADMTEALATFFRYTISKVEDLVSVEDELENCKTYFSIQKYRFGDRLRLYIEKDETWEEIFPCRLPKLTLQPILENSIIHGTETKLGTGNLRIAFLRTEKRLVIRISDDGIGMDEETLFQLNKRVRNNSSELSVESKGGIALANVNHRIQLIFGEEYGIQVYSVRGKGTDVEITIPAVLDDKEIKNRGLVR